MTVCRALSPIYTLTAAEQLRSFSRPVLLVWPHEDRFFPYSYAERLAALLPDARLVPVEDSYTFVSEDQPEALVSAIVAFMAEKTASAPASVAATG